MKQKPAREVLQELGLRVDPVIEEYKKHIDRTLIRENLRRSVEERMANLVALQKLAEEARRAGRRARGTK